MSRKLIYEDYLFQSTPVPPLPELNDKYPNRELTVISGYTDQSKGSEGWAYVKVYIEN